MYHNIVDNKHVCNGSINIIDFCSTITEMLAGNNNDETKEFVGQEKSYYIQKIKLNKWKYASIFNNTRHRYDALINEFKHKNMSMTTSIQCTKPTTH